MKKIFVAAALAVLTTSHASAADDNAYKHLVVPNDLGGKSAGDIAIAHNTQGKLIFNARIAGDLNAVIPYDLLTPSSSKD